MGREPRITAQSNARAPMKIRKSEIESCIALLDGDLNSPRRAGSSNTRLVPVERAVPRARTRKPVSEAKITSICQIRNAFQSKWGRPEEAEDGHADHQGRGPFRPVQGREGDRDGGQPHEGGAHPERHHQAQGGLGVRRALQPVPPERSVERDQVGRQGRGEVPRQPESFPDHRHEARSDGRRPGAECGAGVHPNRPDESRPIPRRHRRRIRIRPGQAPEAALMAASAVS